MTVPKAASTEIKSPFNGPRADLGKRGRATDTVIIVTAIVAGFISAATCSYLSRSRYY